MRRDACALIRRPLPSTGLSPASPVLWADLPVRCTQTGPTSPRRSLPLRFPSGSAPAAPARGDGGTSRVPDASRPCVPTAEAPVDARLLSPWRATATAFPAVAYGSASTVLGISGLVPFTPAVCGFRPTEFLSTLRLGRHRPETQDSVPATGWLAPSPVGLPAHRPDAQVTHWEAPTLPGARNVPYYEHAGYRNGVHRCALSPRKLRCDRGRLPGGSAGPAGADRVGASREEPYPLCLATPLGRRVGRRDRSPSPQSPHHHGVEGVRSGEAELAQHSDAHSTTRRRKMLRPVLVPYYARCRRTG